MEPGFEDHSEKLPLYDRLGGRIFITLITEKFCDRILEDPKLASLLWDVDPAALKKTASELANSLLSEDGVDTVSFLSELGKKVPISQTQFNRLVSQLIAALIWAGVNRELIEDVLDLVTPLSAQLVQPNNGTNNGTGEG